MLWIVLGWQRLSQTAASSGAEKGGQLRYQVIEQPPDTGRGAHVLVHRDPDIELKTNQSCEHQHQRRIEARNAVPAAADLDPGFERAKLRQIAVAAKAEQLPRRPVAASHPDCGTAAGHGRSRSGNAFPAPRWSWAGRISRHNGDGRTDLPKIFALLAERKIAPVIAEVFPLERARQALERLATGTVAGKIVLRCD